MPSSFVIQSIFPDFLGLNNKSIDSMQYMYLSFWVCLQDIFVTWKSPTPSPHPPQKSNDWTGEIRKHM